MKKSLKLTTKLLFTFSVLLLSSLIFAISCNKDGDGGGGDGYTPLCEVGECLEIHAALDKASYVKVVDKTNVVINAKALENSMHPFSRDDDADRAFPSFGTSAGRLFDVRRKGSLAAIILVNRSHVTKDTIALDAAKADCKNASENADNLVAQRAGGGTCRTYQNDANKLFYYSYLGTVFNNTDTQKARGTMRCGGLIARFRDFLAPAITDDTKLINGGSVDCFLHVVNNRLPGFETAEIDDNWVDGPGGTATEEVEFYATSFDVSEKTIPQFLPSSENFNLTEYNKAIDNATFKKLFNHNLGKDFKFKVKIVKSTDF